MSKGFKLTWRGPEVLQNCVENQASALDEFGALVIQEARAELYPGHGYRTGNLYRSLYHRLVLTAERINVEVGSPLSYALWVHQGHGSFPGYHYLWIGLQRATPQLEYIVARHGLHR